MVKRLTPIERFISEIPTDRRRAYDARQADAGLKRVTVTVPVEHVDTLKTISRFFRNSPAEDVDYVRRALEDTLRCDYEAMDDDIASGRWNPDE